MKSIIVLLAMAGTFALGFVLGTGRVVPEQGEVFSAQPKAVLVDGGVAEGTDEERRARRLTRAEAATISLFEKAIPSVVFINTIHLRQDFWTRDIMEIPRGSGSGFIWDKAGHVVTNYHVVHGADRATVTLADRSVWEADLVGYAREKDLAILRIKAPVEKLAPLPVGTSDDLLVGQSVFAIGNPFGLDQTLTTGIISALGREIKAQDGTPIRDVIQTDAAINPGNSGGPLLDSQGRLIGVNTAIYSPSGAYAGIGFSIPVDQVSWVVPDLIRYGRVLRPSLGIDLFSQSTVSRAGLSGAVISDVQAGGPADKAGLRPTRRTAREIILGDIIVAINDDNIRNNADLQLSLEKFRAGDRVHVTVMRGRERVTVPVTLELDK